MYDIHHTARASVTMECVDLLQASFFFLFPHLFLLFNFSRYNAYIHVCTQVIYICFVAQSHLFYFNLHAALGGCLVLHLLSPLLRSLIRE